MTAMPTLNLFADNPNTIMATLSIRNLPESVHAALRIRAAQKGRSMEAEVRHILIELCEPLQQKADFSQLQTMVKQLYGDNKPDNVVDELIAERRSEAQRE